MEASKVSKIQPGGQESLVSDMLNGKNLPEVMARLMATPFIPAMPHWCSISTP
jgi:hypothetical protein